MKKFLGILGAVIAAAAIYFGIMFAPEIKGAFLGNTPEPPTQDVEEPGEPTGDVVAGVQDSDMLRLTKKNKVSANGTALSVSATLAPDWVVDKTVNWTLSWASSNSGNLADYITITPSTDTLTCTVSVKKAFTTQIILTCTANSNDKVKATCTIDYVSRTLTSSYDYTDLDLSGEKYDSITINEVLTDEYNYLDASGYSTINGTLNGVVKNVKYSAIMIGDKMITEEDYSKTLESWLIEEFGSLTDAVSYFSDNNYDIEIYVSADVYYGDTLIKSGAVLQGPFRCHLFIDLFGYTATGLTLNDTQLIF